MLEYDYPKTTHFQKMKVGNALTFLFFLDQKLRKLNGTLNVNAQKERISEAIMASVSFCPENPRINLITG